MTAAESRRRRCRCPSPLDFSVRIIATLVIPAERIRRLRKHDLRRRDVVLESVDWDRVRMRCARCGGAP